MSDLVAVLVAAGRSRRMGGEKLWIDLWGRPVWRWSLDTLLAVPMLSRVAVVAPLDSLERFGSHLPPGQADRCLLVAGGEQRVDSVRAGLETLAAAGVGRDAIVMVHDAARPAASSALMAAVARAAAEHGASVPVVAVSDTLKRVAEGLVSATLARDEVMAAQTPQAASLGILTAALEAARAASRSTPTDEASALGAIGVPVAIVAGERANLKVTESGDEDVARAVLRDRALVGLGIAAPELAPGLRAGIGFDAHRLEAGIPLRLGGLTFAEETRGLTGHSDGDAVLHAVIDAVLGAAGLGDVGTLFPPVEAQWSGADSADLLRRAAAHLIQAGLRIRAVDVAVVAARPAIAPVRTAMAARIAELLRIPTVAVTVKGTTSDGLGFGGEEGIAAYAVASVERIGPPAS